MDKYTSKTTSVTPTVHTETKQETRLSEKFSSSVTDVSISLNSSLISQENTHSVTPSLNTIYSEIVPSSTIKDEISTTITTKFQEVHVNSTPTITGNVTHIESSMKDVLQTMKEELSTDIATLPSTATEKLPETILHKTSKIKTSTSIVETPTITGDYFYIFSIFFISYFKFH